MGFLKELADIVKAGYGRGKGIYGVYVGLVVLFCFAIAVAEILKVALG